MKREADPPFSTQKPSSSTFESLDLSQPLIAALKGISIRDPTEIQSACIPPILQGASSERILSSSPVIPHQVSTSRKGREPEADSMLGRDCIGGAKTGSGKTLAFALPIVERIARDPYGIWGLVLTPTRELAYQLAEQFLAVGKPLGLKTITVVGGMDMMTQAAELETKPHIVVATPGRLCDLLRSNATGQSKLGRVQVLVSYIPRTFEMQRLILFLQVLDEADRLLTPTFAPDLSYLFSQMPPKRQTCLFTATISDAIMQLAQKPPQPGKQKPFVYRVESECVTSHIVLSEISLTSGDSAKTVLGLKQKYLFIPSQIRDPYLIYLLQHPLADIDALLRAPTKRKIATVTNPRSRKKRQASESEDEDGTARIPSTIIFTQRCATAHLLHHLLEQLDIPSVPLHSHLTQPQRLESLARFRAQQVPILVTTDVGSRGLDIPQVAMVINWDCPRRSDDYVHRVGRTARAGRGGVAVTVVTEKDVELVNMIEEEVGVKMTELELPEEEVLEGLNAVSLARRMATMVSS